MNKKGSIIVIMIAVLAIIASILWFLSFFGSKNTNVNARDRKPQIPNQSINP
jgi:flagellar basal body-associated protein FliL